MNFIIYESSSFGGCYDYSLQLHKHFPKHADIKRCTLVLPKNAEYSQGRVKKILLSDSIKISIPVFKKLHFLLRIFLNPILFFVFLIVQKPSVILLNDFEQFTSFLWVPLFKLLKRKHLFSVFLHDPDRDAYPPSKKISEWTMKKIMSIMKIAFYHDFLPEKKYYRAPHTNYVKVPHGIYPSKPADKKLLNELTIKKGDKKYFSIIGNIRDEKNYGLIINTLKNFPGITLIIAGKAANSNVDTNSYKQSVKKNGMENRVLWIERFLSNEEMASVIQISDVIVLYYKKTFASQSAIINLIAPFKRQVIISDGESSLAKVASKFNLGILVKPDNPENFQQAVKKALVNENLTTENWEAYCNFASWDKHVEIAVKNFKDKNL